MGIVKKIASSLLYSTNSRRIKDKIIVFESDDWGSIRTPSIEAAEKIKALGGYTADSAYLEYDTLESEADLSMLFELLDKYKDRDGNPLVVTANFVMSNPNFERISESHYENYYFEKFPQTYEGYFGTNNIMNLINEGIRKGVIFPQFHGREHVNVPLWMKMLKKHDSVFLAAFENKFFGIQTSHLSSKNRNIQATYDLEKNSDFIKTSIVEGLKLFQEVFGFHSKSFIPNNYIWNQDWNNILIENGVEYLQGIRIQNHPLNDDSNRRRVSIKRLGGRKEKYGVISIVRNVTFEPSFKKVPMQKIVRNCISEIKLAFLLKQPAVISMHRVNLVSGLSVENRDRNLELLEELLFDILRIWPDVKFMSTEQLGNYYKENIS